MSERLWILAAIAIDAAVLGWAVGGVVFGAVSGSFPVVVVDGAIAGVAYYLLCRQFRRI